MQKRRCILLISCGPIFGGANEGQSSLGCRGPLLFSMEPLLSKIIAARQYEELGDAWRVPDPSTFAYGKTLYDYQQEALQAAAKVLALYYGGTHAWQENEPLMDIEIRKQEFAKRYAEHQADWPNGFHIRRLKNKRDRDVFDIFARRFDSVSRRGFDTIEYWNLINRMCFWMATGSGKTLVMIKLIEYLHHLKKHGLIPPHNIMLLAPSDLVLRQIRQMVDDFNKRGKKPYLEMVPLRTRRRGLAFGDVERVYYERSDNISDVQKEALWRHDYYDNEGRCYVVLDEAHKGGQGESKRRAYYALLARNGFLFNFSATFTDAEDIATTAYKFNLSNFINRGYGKHLLLSRANFPDQGQSGSRFYPGGETQDPPAIVGDPGLHHPQLRKVKGRGRRLSYLPSPLNDDVCEFGRHRREEE